MKAARRDGGRAGRISARGLGPSSSSTQGISQSGASSGPRDGSSDPGAAARPRRGLVGVGVDAVPAEATLRLRRSSTSWRRRSTRSRISVAWEAGGSSPAPASSSAAGSAPDSGAGLPSATRLRMVQLQCSEAEASGGGCNPEVRLRSRAESDSSTPRGLRRRSVSSIRDRGLAAWSEPAACAPAASTSPPDRGGGCVVVPGFSGRDSKPDSGLGRVAPSPGSSGLTERDQRKCESWEKPRTGNGGEHRNYTAALGL